MSNRNRKHNTFLLFVSIACMTIALLVRADIAVQQATAPAPRPHAVLRLSVAGNDFGADAWSAKAGAAGYIEIWAMPAGADDYRPLIQVIGTPALEVETRRRPGVRRDSSAVIANSLKQAAMSSQEPTGHNLSPINKNAESGLHDSAFLFVHHAICRIADLGIRNHRTHVTPSL